MNQIAALLAKFGTETPQSRSVGQLVSRRAEATNLDQMPVC